MKNFELGIRELERQEGCCPACGKRFIIQSKDDYVYKIKERSGHTEYYCGYSHWLPAVRQLEEKARQSEDAYFRRLRDKKNKENKRRRDRKNG